MVNFGPASINPTGRNPTWIDAQLSSPAERRQVTVLACELVSELDADLDDISCQLERYRADVALSVSRHGGLLIGDIGGSILAVWGAFGTTGSSMVGVHSPRTALLAALDIAARRYRAARIKLAVDAGIVIVNHNRANNPAGDLVGRVLSDASALRAYSGDHTVVISDAVRQMAADAFVFAPLVADDAADRIGNAQAQPLTRPQLSPQLWPQLWRVTACKPHLQPLDRRAPRLVGNRCQRAILAQALSAVLARNRQIVVVTGEAGIGKSALLRHFRAGVTASTARWVEATCRPETSHATLQPIRDLLRLILPKSDIDWLSSAPTDISPTVPTLLDLEAGDRQLLGRFFNANVHSPAVISATNPRASNPGWPSNRQQRLVNLLIDIISEIATIKPIFLALEDLHWADSETLEFLGLLIERSTRWRQFGLALVVRRHAQLPKRITQRATVVTVDRLSTAETVELLTGAEPLAMSAQHLTADVLRVIAQRSEGVPLFAEQLAALYVHTTDPVKASAILASPTSLNLTLAARLDALGDHRSLAQAASVLGRDFDGGVLAHMLAMAPAHLQSGLAALVASGLVTMVTDGRHVSHRFSHALVRDAAYASLLRQQRRQLHAHAADTINEHFVALAHANPEAMAQHYTEAGASTIAARWWRLAAEGALGLSQLKVAVTHLQRGLALVAVTADQHGSGPDYQPSGLPEQDEELAIRRLLGPCLTMLAGNGADAVIANYRRCLQLTTRSAPTPFEILWGLQGCYSVRGELADALAFGDQAIMVAEVADATRRDGDIDNNADEQCLLAHRMQGLTRLQAGDIAQSISHYQEVQRRYMPQRHECMRFRYASDQGALAQAHWAWAEAVAGNLAASEQLAEQALARADQLAHVLAVLATRAQTLRQREVAAPLAFVARNLAQAHGFTYWSAWSEIILGWHEAAHSPEASLIRIEHAIQDYRRTGAGQALPYALLLKAEVALDAGLWDLATRTTADGLRLARAGGLGLYIGELLRVRAQALMQSATAVQPGPSRASTATVSSVQEAQLALADAIALSAQQGTRVFAMRAAVTLLQGFLLDPSADQSSQHHLRLVRHQAGSTLRHVLAEMARPSPLRSAAPSAPATAQQPDEITAALALVATLPDDVAA